MCEWGILFEKRLEFISSVQKTYQETQILGTTVVKAKLGKLGVDIVINPGADNSRRNIAG